MVTILMCGGTGNQLFQYAFGKALEAAGNDVQYDVSVFDHDPARAYTLDHWNVDVRTGAGTGEHINEGDLRYNPDWIKKYDRDVTLAGYWQCEKYFLSLRDRLLREFTLREKPSAKTLAIRYEIENSNSVFLHVRRTDNLSARGLAFHGLGSVQYWTHATQEIFKKVPDPKFFIFSDDIEWCKQQTFFAGATFVDHNTTGVTVDPEYSLAKTSDGTEHEDLWLMSRCKHGITATSTFSWWGAWLIPNPKKIIVTPERWFVGQFEEQSRDIRPESWIRL